MKTNQDVQAVIFLGKRKIKTCEHGLQRYGMSLKNLNMLDNGFLMSGLIILGVKVLNIHVYYN